MDDDDDSQETRRIRAQRYADYVRQQMNARDWRQADVARRADIKPATVNQIVQGESVQPTVKQIAGLARAFRVRPDEIFAAIGMWEPTGDARLTVPPHVADVWADLDPIAQRAADEHLRVVRTMQRDYERRQHQPDYEPTLFRAGLHAVAEEPEPFEP